MIPNYEVTQNLLRNERQTLDRGRRISDEKPVLIKTPGQTIQASNDGELLAGEYQLLRQIHINGIPGPVELSRTEGDSCTTFLVMEDGGGLPLSDLITSRKIDLNVFFKLAIQIAQIVAELHRQDVILRNINPHNLLFNPTSGEVWLTDLGLAIKTAGDIQNPIPARFLPAALAYASPELTGRMNRVADYRTDFYSLGITFYELLTGRHPFQSADAMELIHWHIAKTPLSPSELDPKIPEPLSGIILKLLAKTAEDRYQSALGLRADLEVCAREWNECGRVAPFQLGNRDFSNRFLIPQKLYGREREVEKLLEAFEQICEGQAAMMLVAGYSGIGKTSLIQELYQPIVRQKGYFISGKFDQVARGVPFGALIQAFRGLVRQLLTESEEKLTTWRAILTEALGGQGRALAEVIPEIELIVGKQPPLPNVGLTEALNRFQLVFQNFVGAIARPNHPLVVFLDDLQWADSATLSLLGPLLTNSGVQSLFLMGAYRDNEVDAAHPLMRTLSSLEAAGGKINKVTLGALSPADLTRFVGDTLHCDFAEAAPLADLVWKKTNGNPFFVIQFLKTLRQDDFLKFDYEQGRWTYRIDDIARAEMTDNVIDLMTQKIQRLSSQAQRVLTLASCIGNSFDGQTLAVVSEQSSADATDALSEAINEGLVLQATNDGGMNGSESPPSYFFLHDRVQQAAYAMIPDEWKQLVHLAVGRLLLERQDVENTEDKLFDVVRHLNLGSSLMVEEQERLALARLNLSAGQKAKTSTAYAAALDYLKAGANLLDENHWESDYDLAFSLRLEAIECQRLCGYFVEAEQEYDELLRRARTKLDQARVYNLRMLQYEAQSQYSNALSCAREGLGLFGVSFPESRQDQELALEEEIAAIESLIGNRQISSLVELPVMTDPEIRMVMSLLTIIWSSAYISGQQALTRLISATMVRLSLVHGNSEESAYGYVTHAITVGPERADYESAYEFGMLALRINERFNDSRLRAKICQQFQAHVTLWRRPLETCLTYAQEARRSGFESGDFTYAIYGAFTESWAAIVITNDLSQYVGEYTPNLALFKKLKVAAVGDGMKVMLNWAQALRGKTKNPLSLSDEEFDEDVYAETYRGNHFYTMFYAAAKLHLGYLMGEYVKALEFARFTRQIVPSLSGTIWTVICDFWESLTLAANYVEATQDERREFLHQIKLAQHSMATLAENCPENFLCQSLLLSAEIERISKQDFAAVEFYERAIRQAEETDRLQLRALAKELYARFRLACGEETAAAVLLTEARDCYAQWGASAKVEELNLRYASLPGFKTDSPPEVFTTKLQALTHPDAGSLDLFSVMKASQAIAGEIELEKLLAKLMRIAIENAGAERGYLLLEHNGDLFIHAEGSLDAAEVKLHNALQLSESQNLPLSIVNYVRHTSEGVVLSDAATETGDEGLFGGDPYILRRQPRSVMCVPVLNQGRLIGILYLENNLAGGAFTEDRIKVCQILASQAAISLENARLYDEMKSSEETLRSIMEGTAAVTGGDFFASLVRHLAHALQVRYAFVTECRERVKTKARTLAFWMGDRMADNVTYDIAETPCVKVLAGETCYYPNGVQQLFPNDKDLVDLSAEGYLGIPLCNGSGSVIGHLAVLDDKPMAKTPQGLSLLNIFAARAGAELERLHAEEELRMAMEEVERLKNRLHEENVYLQEEIRREHNFEEIVGGSPALLNVLQQVERVAPTNATVLILGETGTGKELIARAIHDRSNRRNRPLVKVNCGAISAGLVESELFGHIKGAFTGALGNRTGRFELADGGTLFLDEVGELPLETQVKLLRVLQEGEFEPVGSSKTIKVDVRIIAATNRNLEDEVKAGRFRADLYYRLNVLPMQNPPLRERKSDIPQLAMFFLSRYSRQFGRQIDGIAQETMERLVNYDWPGNIRELQNLIERGVVLSNGSVLTIDGGLLPTSQPAQLTQHKSDVHQPEPAKKVVQSATPAVSSSPPPPSTSLDELQRQHILNVLAQTNWVIEGVNGAAKMLNLHPNTLRSRLKKMGIQRPIS
ncbi:MAG: sigma 54-interacting transcriptional regulator [Blastocatellales bacterium]